MKKLMQAASAVLCVICLLAVQLPRTEADRQGPNLTRYIPYPHRAEDVDKAHTIHWARGITPPVMPGQIMEDGTVVEMKQADFTMIDVNDNPTTPETNKTAFGYYVAEYQPGQGWYDVDKNHFYAPERKINDENACYAAASANVISWWLDQNRDNVEQYLELVNDPSVELQRHPELADPAVLRDYLDAQTNGFPSTDPAYSMPYRLLVDGFHAVGNYDGGHPHAAMDPFFNGYLPRVMEAPNRPDQFTPFHEGGFFYPVFGLSTLTFESWYTRYDVLNTSFKGFFDAGYGVTIGYRHLGGAHAVSVWGAEYDENDNLCGLYLTDSNDAGELRLNYRNWERENCVGSMRRYDCYSDRNGVAAIGSNAVVNPNSGSFLYSVCILDTAEEEWDFFLKHHVPMYEDNRPLVTNEDYLHPVKDPVREPAWTVELAGTPDLSGERVRLELNVSNTGREDTVTLVVVGYDKNGRQLDSRTAAVTAEQTTVKQTVELDNRLGGLAQVRAFLVDEHSAPKSEAVQYPVN